MDGRGLLAVYAHPDDEAIYSGGTLARYAGAGVRVECATATRGELGQIVDPALATAANLERLGEVRMDEMRRAVSRLGPIGTRWLGYRDSGAPGDRGHDEADAFMRTPVDEVAARIARVIREVRPHVVITLDETRVDDHQHHVHAAVSTREAFERAGDPNAWPDQLTGEAALEPWSPTKLYAANGRSMAPIDATTRLRLAMRERGLIGVARTIAGAAWRHLPVAGQGVEPDAPGRPPATTRIDVAPWVAARHAALHEYRTQIGRGDELLRLRPRELARLSPTEDYRLLAGPEPSIPEDDLFAGVD